MQAPQAISGSYQDLAAMNGVAVVGSPAAIAAANAGAAAARAASPSHESGEKRYRVRVVTGNSNRELAESIASRLGVDLTDAKVTTFKDGECNVSIRENVRGADVFVVQSTSPPVNDNLMELLIIIDALKRASARRITAVVPYYGYARQDRKEAPRVPITARLVADLIVAAGAHRVLAFELHAGQIQGFFNIPVDHMFANPVFEVYFREQGLPENLVVVSPDAGGIVRARALAKRLDASLAIIDKRRSAPNEAAVMHVIGAVEGRNCIIIDDIVDTAGTLTEAAKALDQYGASSVRACCVHPVLSGPAIERLEASPISTLVVTDSIALSEEKKISKIEVVTTAPLIAETINRVHNEQSVSTLFGEM